MSMEDLHVPLMVDILSRLPVKTIIHCKCVCKKWLDLISDSYFVNLHMSRSATVLLIHLASGNEMTGYRAGGFLKLVEIEDELDHHHLHHDPVLSLDLDPITRGQDCRLIPVGSVNGLICLAAWHQGYQSDSTYICNPITREFMILPGKQITGEYMFCFGVGSLSQEYKVIRISHCTLKAEVYTLRTGRWRNVGRVPYRLRGKLYGTFLNGHAHWMVADKHSPEKLFVFDFDNERFELFPAPPSEADVEVSFHKSLGILKRCLCVGDRDLNKLKVWVMKEYGIKKSWHKELVIQQSIANDLELVF